MRHRSFPAWLTTGVVAAILFQARAAETAKPLPKELPPYGPLKPFSLSVVTRLKLNNGLTVWLAPVSGFPKVAFALAVHGGYAADPKDRPGISEMLASTVTQGTLNRNARQIAEEVQACGGDLEAKAQTDRVLLQTSVLAEKTGPALELLADVAQNAAFADQEVRLAKQKSASTLEANQAEPSFLGRRALYHGVFGEHPYSVISPTKESIEQMTAGDLKQQYARRFRPDGAILVAVGAFDGKQLEIAIRQYFDGWKKPAAATDISVPPPSARINKTVFYVPRPNSVQTTFYIGGLAPTRGQSDYEAAYLANATYGGMFGSRLVLNIREDKGYTYSPGSHVTPYEATGLLVTRADVRNPVTGASFNEISYELNRIATTPPGSEELDHAKRYVIGTLAVDLQSQANLARTLAEYWAQSLSPEDLAREGQRFEQVSAADVQNAGRKYFPMWLMTTVAVGEEKVIKQELAPFGLEFKKAE